MLSFNSFFFILTLSLFLKSYSCQETCHAPSKVLDTLNGKILGECHKTSVYYTSTNITQTDVLSWLSVPYAQPPINQNRFGDPVPVNSWKNTLDGTVSPKSCLQLNTAINKTSEDCLYLNIYVQANSYANRYNLKKLGLVMN